jgi:two-component system alkaline phosphatase synthesis response regulator PhoP
VAARLRRLGVHTPILMLTARDELDDKVNGLRAGADDYLTKPFEVEELLARVEALMRRASRAPASRGRAFEVGGMRIDFAVNRVLRGQEVIELSDQESRLLRYMVDHRGEVVSRDTLLREVWGYESIPITRTVDAHVSWLRQKLEEDPRNPRLIVTVHGQGYRFDG